MLESQDAEITEQDVRSMAAMAVMFAHDIITERTKAEPPLVALRKAALELMSKMHFPEEEREKILDAVLNTPLAAWLLPSSRPAVPPLYEGIWEDICHQPLTVEVSFEFVGEWTGTHTFVMESTSRPVLTIVDDQGNPLPGCSHCSASMEEKFEKIAKLMEGGKADGA